MKCWYMKYCMKLNHLCIYKSVSTVYKITADKMNVKHIYTNQNIQINSSLPSGYYFIVLSDLTISNKNNWSKVEVACCSQNLFFINSSSSFLNEPTLLRIYCALLLHGVTCWQWNHKGMKFLSTADKFCLIWEL